MNFQDSLNQISGARQRYLDFMPPQQQGGLPPLGQPSMQQQPMTETPTPQIPAPVIPQPPAFAGDPAAAAPALTARQRLRLARQTPAASLTGGSWGGWAPPGGWGPTPQPGPGSGQDGAPGASPAPQGLPPLFDTNNWRNAQSFFPALFQTIMGPQNYDRFRAGLGQYLPPLGGGQPSGQG